MDKLNKLGGTKVMHHRAAARPEMGEEGEKAGREEEADHDGDRGHPPHPRLVHGLDRLRTNAQLRVDKVERVGKEEKRDRHLG